MKHSLMLGNVSEELLNASLAEADYYENIARQMERVADHVVKIARLVEKNSLPANVKLEKTLQTGSDKIILLLKETENFVKAVDKKLANGVLIEINKLPLHANSIYEEMAKIGYGRGLILSDSLDRITGYIVNMAEYTLAQATVNQ